MITPKTTLAPAAAPSVASDSAKQLASLANRIGRSSSCDRSSASGLPFNQVEFEFLIRPVAGEIVPGMPIPTLPLAPISRSISRTRPATASSVFA